MLSVSVHDYANVVANFREGGVLPESLLLERSGEFSTYYAPFEYINTSAKEVLCGITPGLQQATIALGTAGIAAPWLRRCRKDDEIVQSRSRVVKRRSLRKALIPANVAVEERMK